MTETHTDAGHATTERGATRRGAADIVYDAFYSGAIGGSLVALFFLFVDLLRAVPFFTPSLMGAVLFEGADAASVHGVDLGLVALYSMFHFASFVALGLLAAVVVHRVELRSRHPAVMLVVLFLIFEIAFVLVAARFMPGAIMRVGPLYVAIANLLAAAGMGIFFISSHQPATWRRLKKTVRI